MATLAAVRSLPALALLGEDGRLERSTEPFRRWYEGKEGLCRSAPELKRVQEGQAHAAVMKLDGIGVDIAAMTDRDGARHVLLTLPTGALPSLGDPGEALLDGALDESPALVWLKDLEGRYVRVNARFTSALGTSEERLLGRTDAELPPAETVDGPRAQDRPEGVEEPLQLEYMVGPFQGRDSFVVLRFPVGDRQGIPTLVCGVAAPSSEAQVARSEAARLLRVERWSRLDAESVQAELLAEWGLLPDARGRSAASAPSAAAVTGSAEQEAAVAEARAERATAVAERDSALEANEKLTGQLESTRARLAELERALEAARADGERGDAEAKLAEHAAELDRALARERERAEELDRSLALVRQRLGDDAEAARAEVQRARADADAARTEVERARADAEAARADVEKARADAEAARAAGATERESAASARTQLERELRESRDQLLALERQQGADDSGAQLRAAEKARVSAESALAAALSERDAALKARAVLEGQLEHERGHVAAGLEQAQARSKELEVELRGAVMRADKAEIELEVAAGRIEKAEAEVEQARARAEQTAAALEGELRQAREKLTALERNMEADDSGARLQAAEKARLAAEERILELAGGMERERVRAAGLDQAQARVKELEAELRTTVMRADKAEVELDVDRVRISELESHAKRAQARLAELEGELAVSQARVAELEAELETARAEAEEQAAAARAVDEAVPVDSAEPMVSSEAAGGSAGALARLDDDDEDEATPSAGGVSWHPAAKRTLSASLARESVWRNVLKETVEVLGSEGGWDTVTAWLPDDGGSLGCAATWTAHRGLDRFESLTSDAALRRDGSLLDQALQAPHLTWLTDIDTVDDERLQTASSHGMNSALLLPIRTGTTTIGLLELLTHDTVEPDAQIALSLEASALQLGRFGHLLSLGKS